MKQTFPTVAWLFWRDFFEHVMYAIMYHIVSMGLAMSRRYGGLSSPTSDSRDPTKSAQRMSVPNQPSDFNTFCCQVVSFSYQQYKNEMSEWIMN